MGRLYFSLEAHILVGERERDHKCNRKVNKMTEGDAVYGKNMIKNRIRGSGVKEGEWGCLQFKIKVEVGIKVRRVNK